MDNFEFFTEEEKNDYAYKACVASTTVIGMGVGSLGGLGVASAPGALLGGGMGFVIGLYSCKYLKEPIRKKLFSAHSRLSDREVLATIKAVHRMHPQISKNDALALVARARLDYTLYPERYRAAVAGHAAHPRESA
jgi:hypothetical protein